jgi:Escherichia/Staphylococcus phage prohead protease
MDKTKPEFEKRVMNIRNLEIRSGEGEGETPKITGYAAVFNEVSEELWGFREKIAPGAFDDVLEDDVRATFNHDSNYILGRSLSGTLKLEQDDIGLRVEINPPPTAWARDLLVTMERGDVDRMSFHFRVAEDGDEWLATEEGDWLRTLNKFSELFDVSVVAFPAYPQTSAEVRARFEEVREIKTPETIPRDLDKEIRLKRMKMNMG